MKDFIIVIGRQFGCGGREIGKNIAAAFNVPYYDKTLLSEAAEEFGLSSDVFDHVDERRPSFLRNFLGLHDGTSLPSGAGSLSPEGLYSAQARVIRSICAKGSCVIVGRTADHIMRHHPGLVSIFIQAPIAHRVKNIIARGDAAHEEEAEALAQEFDRKRESYYRYYTSRPWGTAGNYHLTFDSSRFSTQAIIELLRSYIKD